MPSNAVESPGPENAQAGANLAMYETGPIAVNLGKYVGYKAARETVRCSPVYGLSILHIDSLLTVLCSPCYKSNQDALIA